MKTIEYINKTRDYLDYIEEHLLNVKKAWEVLSDKCSDMRFIYDDYVYQLIDSEIENHDLSKLSASELVQYRKCFYPVDGEERKALGDAWEHHKTENKHHWESFAKKNNANPYEGEVNCVHMVADWMAIGYKVGDTAKEYYESSNYIDLSEDDVKFIYEIFVRVYK